MSFRNVIIGLVVVVVAVVVLIRVKSVDESAAEKTEERATNSTTAYSSGSGVESDTNPEKTAKTRPKSIEELESRIEARVQAERETKTRLEGEAIENRKSTAANEKAVPEEKADPAEPRNTASGPDITTEEQAVLVLYENMASAFERFPDNCEEMGIAVGEFVEESTPAVSELARSRSRMAPEERAAATQRLEREAADQLKALRQAMRIGVSKCPNEPRLQEALRRLAELGAG